LILCVFVIAKLSRFVYWIILSPSWNIVFK
jgi:hypothetical protein